MSCVKSRRLFLALWPDAATRADLAGALARLTFPVGARPLVSADWHVTLAFLGTVPEVARASIAARLADFPVLSAPLVLDALSWWEDASLLVLEARHVPPALVAAQAALCAGLVESCWRLHARPWRPHVTIARAVSSAPALSGGVSCVWPIRRIALAESLPTVGPTRYALLVDHELI